jgi:hypothetical protein
VGVFRAGLLTTVFALLLGYGPGKDGKKNKVLMVATVKPDEETMCVRLLRRWGIMSR